MADQAPRFTFRRITDADLPLLHTWLNRPHVAEWWDDRQSFAEVEEDYGSKAQSQGVQFFFACIENVPVGFIQAYEVFMFPVEWPGETDPHAKGIDQFLAEAAQLGKGLGTQMVAQFVRMLFEDPRVTKIQTDPAPDNGRAIRAYEKSGFVSCGLVTTPDGPALLMRIRRA